MSHMKQVPMDHGRRTKLWVYGAASRLANGVGLKSPFNGL
jgi:hypothetical protein